MANQADLAQTLAEYSVASISQLAVLLSTSPAQVRRWVRISTDVRILAGLPGRGRPEQWICLKGFRGRAHAHEWNLTQFAVELSKLCRAMPNLSWTRLAASFDGLVPDLSFVLTSAVRQKSLLFFVEIDCGTEPVRRETAGTDLSGKLARYLDVRATNRYLGTLANTGLACRGFRVLVVTPDVKRSNQARRLTCGLRGDFIWVTDRARLGESGMAAKIWTAGGQDEPRRSILGSLVQ